MSLDEAFIDLTGCGKLHGPVLKTAETIRNEIKGQLGLNASIGIATNKLIAKIASAYCKPSGMLWIAPGSEQQFFGTTSYKTHPRNRSQRQHQAKSYGCSLSCRSCTLTTGNT